MEFIHLLLSNLIGQNVQAMVQAILYPQSILRGVVCETNVAATCILLCLKKLVTRAAASLVTAPGRRRLQQNRLPL